MVPAGLLMLLSSWACESPNDRPDTRESAPATRSASVDQSASRGQPTVEWSAPLTVAEGPARAGPWRMNDSDFHYVDDPTVDITDDGKVGVAWVDNQAQSVRFQAFGRNGEPVFDEPTAVSKSPETFSWLPRLVLTGPPENHVYILWQEIVFSGGSHGGEAFFARSTDGGQSFSQPQNLSNTTNGVGKGRLTEEIWHNGSLDLAVGPEGTVFTTWTSYQGPLHVARSTNAGRTFSDPLHVAGDAQTPARAPSIAVEDAETVHLAWTVGEDDGADLRLATSDDSAESFGEPSIVLESDGHSDAPKLAVDEEGTLHLAYGESPEGMFEQYHVRYARQAKGEEGFGSSRRLSEASETTAQGARFPSLALGARDALFMLWNLYPTGEHPPRGLGFTASVDGGNSFYGPSAVPGSTAESLGINGSLQGMLMEKIAANTAGHVAVVNSRFKRGIASRIRLYRGQVKGANE